MILLSFVDLNTRTITESIRVPTAIPLILPFNILIHCTMCGRGFMSHQVFPIEGVGPGLDSGGYSCAGCICKDTSEVLNQTGLALAG